MLDMPTAGLVVFIAVLALAIIDLGLVLFKGTTGSISQFLITTAFKSPMVSVGWGACIGHLFFYMYDTGCEVDWTHRMLIAGCGAGAGIGCYILVKALFFRFRKTTPIKFREDILE